MIVKCIRCNAEFSSVHSETHLCPNCHFVFSEGDSKPAGLDIVRSEDLVRQRTGHRLLEEDVDKCAFHTDADAVGHCIDCGRPLCYACAVEKEGGHQCEPCAEGHKAGPADGRTKGPQKRVPSGPPPDESLPEEAARPRVQTVSKAMTLGPYVAWEYRRQIGRVNALFTTWHQALLTPVRFFRRVPISAGYRSPLLYGLFWVLAGLAGGLFWKLLFYVYPMALDFVNGKTVMLFVHISDYYILAAAGLLLSPFFGLLFLFTTCCLYHLFIILLTRRHAGLEATVRVVCYSTGTNIFFFIPLLGAFIGGAWHFVLVTIGIKEVHRISLPMAVIAAIIPYTFLLMPSVAFVLWAVSGDQMNAADQLASWLASLL